MSGSLEAEEVKPFIGSKSAAGGMRSRWGLDPPIGIDPPVWCGLDLPIDMEHPKWWGLDLPIDMDPPKWWGLDLPMGILSSDTLSSSSNEEEIKFWWGGRRRALPLRFVATPPTGDATLRHGEGAAVLRGERCCACSQTTVSVLKDPQLTWCCGCFRVPRTGDKFLSGCKRICRV